jgi:hypothetical protein
MEDHSSDDEPDTVSGEMGADTHGITISRLPTALHPSIAKLEEFDFNILPEGFFMIVYGARRTGKTHIVEYGLEQIKERFDFAYLFSNTAVLHKNSKDFDNFDCIREEAKFDGFEEDKLIRIFERQKAVLMHNNDCKYQRDKKPNKTLLIFDDFVHEKAIRYSKVFTELPILGRHCEISVICLSQGYSAVGSGGLNKATRENADCVMTFLPRNTQNIEKLAEWYLAKEKLENMWFIQSACKEEFGSVAMDMTRPHETEYENFCYKLIAPPHVPKYEIGKIQWKLYHEERKRQRKASLAHHVENERAYFLTLGEMEKRQRIGQATGQPKREGSKLSLFDAVNNGV